MLDQFDERGYVNTQDDHNSKRQHVYEAKAICCLDQG